MSIKRLCACSWRKELGLRRVEDSRAFVLRFVIDTRARVLVNIVPFAASESMTTLVMLRCTNFVFFDMLCLTISSSHGSLNVKLFTSRCVLDFAYRPWHHKGSRDRGSAIGHASLSLMAKYHGYELVPNGRLKVSRLGTRTRVPQTPALYRIERTRNQVTQFRRGGKEALISGYCHSTWLLSTTRPTRRSYVLYKQTETNENLERTVAKENPPVKPA